MKANTQHTNTYYVHLMLVKMSILCSAALLTAPRYLKMLHLPTPVNTSNKDEVKNITRIYNSLFWPN